MRSAESCRSSMLDRHPVFVIVTRAEPGAADTAQRLVAAGYRPVLSPMLALVRTDVQLRNLAIAAGVIFTSANGVRFFCGESTRRDLVAWCVGPATFAAASAAGFATCHNADGDGAALADLITAQARSKGGPLIHVANAAAQGDLANTLRARGFDVVFAPLYAAEPVQHLTDAAEAVLRTNQPSIIAVHSAKGAAAFAEAAAELDLTGQYAAAISEQAAQPLCAIALADVVIAAAPNEDALFVAISRAAATL